MTIANYEIDLPTLERYREGKWLADDNINGFLFYYTTENEDVLVFKTLLYSFYNEFGYSRVKRFTLPRYIGCRSIFERSYLFFPIHLLNHWALVVYIKSLNQLVYIDSIMKDNPNYILNKIKDYLQEENNSKCEGRYNIDPTFVNLKDCPQQNNSIDCGVFVIAAVLSVLDNSTVLATSPLSSRHLMYSQSDIKRLRENILQYMIANRQEGSFEMLIF